MSIIETASFVHVHVPPTTAGDERTILLLHGTGGNERDLLDLGAAVAPGTRLLGVRGQVLEGGAPRFFRRMAEGVFDESDIIRRAADLAAFVPAAAATYGFDAKSVTALGFSNGANIAAAMLLLHPGVVAGAIMLRSMVPLVPATAPDLTGTRALMIQGLADPLIPRENAERLAVMLRSAGASLSVEWQQGGHGLTPADVTLARTWLSAQG